MSRIGCLSSLVALFVAVVVISISVASAVSGPGHHQNFYPTPTGKAPVSMLLTGTAR